MFSIVFNFFQYGLDDIEKTKKIVNPTMKYRKKLKKIVKKHCFTIGFQYFLNFVQYGLDDIEKTKKIVDPTMKYSKN
jgi:hypothetical protein